MNKSRKENEDYLNIDYDINSADLDEARAQTIMCDGKRFRIFLEVVTSCFGNCSGCSLSFEARKEIKPDMSIERIREILTYFMPIINDRRKVTTTVVNLGTGDYFMMDEEFLDKLFKSIRVFFDKLKTPRKILTITTSLFLSEEKMESRLDIMTRYLHPNQYAIEGVIDPLMLEKHYDRYLKNYKALNKVFPFFDLVLNLSNEVQERHIEIMQKFFDELNILNLDVQYAINNTNIYRVKSDKEHISYILNNIFEHFGEERKDLVELAVAMPTTKEDGQDIFEEILSHAKEIVKERVVVTANGDIYPLGFGYGDIILDHRFEFNPIGNIFEEFNEDKAALQIADYLKEIFLKKRVCHTCEYSRLCYSTGYAFYNKFDTNPKVCENVGNFIFRRIKKDTPIHIENNFKPKKPIINIACSNKVSL